MRGIESDSVVPYCCVVKFEKMFNILLVAAIRNILFYSLVISSWLSFNYDIALAQT